MLIKELPDDVKQEIRARLPDHISFESIENLPLNELPRWMAALREDLERRIERKRRRLAVEQEINDLALSVSEKYSDIPLWKVEYFLHGEVRKRFQALLRELDEMSQVPLVTYGRQPWHRAVEDEINLQLKRGATDVDSVAAAVVQRDSTYPAEQVRAYARYILETSAGLW